MVAVQSCRHATQYLIYSKPLQSWRLAAAAVGPHVRPSVRGNVYDLHLKTVEAYFMLLPSAERYIIFYEHSGSPDYVRARPSDRSFLSFARPSARSSVRPFLRCPPSIVADMQDVW